MSKRVSESYPNNHLVERCDVLEQAGTYIYGSENKDPGSWVKA